MPRVLSCTGLAIYGIRVLGRMRYSTGAPLIPATAKKVTWYFTPASFLVVVRVPLSVILGVHEYVHNNYVRTPYIICPPSASPCGVYTLSPPTNTELGTLTASHPPERPTGFRQQDNQIRQLRKHVRQIHLRLLVQQHSTTTTSSNSTKTGCYPPFARMLLACSADDAVECTV